MLKFIRPRSSFVFFVLYGLLSSIHGLVHAHGTPPPSLLGVKVPLTPGVDSGSNRMVASASYLRILGKAFFWDVNVGSDGMACASCHYHAGADDRSRNQMNPGQKHAAASGSAFEAMVSGSPGGVNYQLRLADFPTYRHADPADRLSEVVYASDDVVGSSGTYLGDFKAANTSGDANDQCAVMEDKLFTLSGNNVRSVTDRNAPTVINAAFNYRNFWDGRANNRFNGETQWGDRDGAAGAWVSDSKGIALKRHLSLENASLASQAVGPPLSDVETSCHNRQFTDIAAKLLGRRALETQVVSREDSLMGSLVHPSGKGLKLSYEDLIKKSFKKNYWSGKGNFGTHQSGAPYTMMQANFALYMGVAIMEYEKTLISNKAPYDTPRDAKTQMPKGLDVQQKRGLQLFLDAHCQNCHGGPTFSNAANPFLTRNQGAIPMLVNRSSLDGSMGPGAMNVLQDVGFANTSVTPTDWDIGLGGLDPWGNPLSYSGLYARSLAKGVVEKADGADIYPCEFEAPFYTDWFLDQLRLPERRYPSSKCKDAKEYDMLPDPELWKAQMASAESFLAAEGTAGAFKIPSLRNVELTAPYFHNGSAKNLEEVIEFYNRGGNLVNRNHSNVFVFPQGFSESEKADLVAFLKSLTDDRVRWEKAPFDHPEIKIPEGIDPAKGAGIRTNTYQDQYFTIPAVGKKGRTASQGPIKTFAEGLAP